MILLMTSRMLILVGNSVSKVLTKQSQEALFHLPKEVDDIIPQKNFADCPFLVHSHLRFPGAKSFVQDEAEEYALEDRRYGT